MKGLKGTQIYLCSPAGRNILQKFTLVLPYLSFPAGRYRRTSLGRRYSGPACRGSVCSHRRSPHIVLLWSHRDTHTGTPLSQQGGWRYSHRKLHLDIHRGPQSPDRKRDYSAHVCNLTAIDYRPLIPVFKTLHIFCNTTTLPYALEVVGIYDSAASRPLFQLPEHQAATLPFIFWILNYSARCCTVASYNIEVIHPYMFEPGTDFYM